VEHSSGTRLLYPRMHTGSVCTATPKQRHMQQLPTTYPCAHARAQGTCLVRHEHAAVLARTFIIAHASTGHWHTASLAHSCKNHKTVTPPPPPGAPPPAPPPPPSCSLPFLPATGTQSPQRQHLTGRPCSSLSYAKTRATSCQRDLPQLQQVLSPFTHCCASVPTLRPAVSCLPA
jgi:hypothetical protein